MRGRDAASSSPVEGRRCRAPGRIRPKTAPRPRVAGNRAIREPARRRAFPCHCCRRPPPGREDPRGTCTTASPSLGTGGRIEVASSPEALAPSTWIASGRAVPLPSRVFGPGLNGTPAADRFSEPGQGFPQRRMPDAFRQCGHLATHGGRRRGCVWHLHQRLGSSPHRSLFQDDPVDRTKSICRVDPFHHQTGAMLKLGGKCRLHANGQHAPRQTDGRRSVGELRPDNLTPLPDQCRFAKSPFAE